MGNLSQTRIKEIRRDVGDATLSGHSPDKRGPLFARNNEGGYARIDLSLLNLKGQDELIWAIRQIQVEERETAIQYMMESFP